MPVFGNKMRVCLTKCMFYRIMTVSFFPLPFLAVGCKNQGEVAKHLQSKGEGVHDRVVREYAKR